VGERRRTERRANARVADLTLPEFRRMLVTTTLFVIVLVLFLWMVRTVVIAAILGVVIAAYLRPLYARLVRRLRRPAAAAFVTLVLALVPAAGLLAYSYVEVAQVATYLAAHQDEVTARIVAAVRRLPFLGEADVAGSVRAWVLAASDYGAKLPGVIKRTVVNFSVATTIFFFTAWYILTDADAIVAYVRGKVPPRYAERPLRGRLRHPRHAGA
jgi:predicted PurR-regulated permease PerM